MPSSRRGCLRLCFWSWLALAVCCAQGVTQEPPKLLFSEDVPPPLAPGAVLGATPVPEPPAAKVDDVQQASCVGCNRGGVIGGASAVPSASTGEGCSGCDGGMCYPGRKPCNSCEGHTVLGRFACGVYDCLCCPDPCYDPKWIPIADSSFFISSARPQTQTGIRWDSAVNVRLLDRAEYFWARADGKGKGPQPPRGNRVENGIKYNDAVMFVEGATAKIGIFVETPYRSLDPDTLGHQAGFGDITLGTKTLLFDCELLQIAMQFKTTLPSGISFKGLGTGHVTLEPSLIFGVRVGPETFLQAQVAEWIPLGGDNDYAGAALKYGVGLNHTICRLLPDVPLIMTAEFNGLSFQDGLFTDPINGPTKAGDHTYFTATPGLRMFVCDRVDFGVGVAFAVSNRHLADHLFRSEFRFRF